MEQIINKKDIRKLNVGDVVFFKECARDTNRHSIKIGFKGGTGFAVMLGIVAPFGKMPTEQLIMCLMGQAGYIAFDDVVNFLGQEAGEKCIKMFQDKYYPKIIQPQEKKLILPVGAKGNPPIGEIPK